MPSSSRYKVGGISPFGKMRKGPSAESEEKREPVSDINTGVLDSLKVLDPRRPIREARTERILVLTHLGPKGLLFVAMHTH